MFHGIANNVFNKIFRKVHIIFQIIKRYFGFYHPKLSKVAGCITILRSKSWPKSIDIAKRHCSQFAFQLSTYGKVGTLAKKIFFIVYATIIIAWGSTIQWQCGYFKHFASALCITTCNNGRMHVHKTPIIIKFMYGISKAVTHSKYSTKSICTHTKMCLLTQKF